MWSYHDLTLKKQRYTLHHAILYLGEFIGHENF